MISDETFPGEAELVESARNVTYIETGESEAQLLAKLPVVEENTDDMLVVTSLRIPLGLHRRLRDYAEAHGVKPSVLIRGWIELHVSSEEENRPILLADALRALAALRPVEQRDAA